MKKSERIAAITNILTENPSRDFSLGYFSSVFGCAKSSVSDDIKVIRESLKATGFGSLETTSGIKGGVRYIPFISDKEAAEELEKIKTLYEEKNRVLGSGFIYSSDIMFTPSKVRGAARIFARRFASVGADIVVTVETKGVGPALFTAELLGLPVAVIRRENKVSEGSTVSINYFSGSTERLQQMSLSKRALKPGMKALIIDDFMRGGGSIKGMQDMLSEFGAETAGVGVVIVAGGRENKKIGSYVPLLIMDEGSDKRISVTINPDIF